MFDSTSYDPIHCFLQIPKSSVHSSDMIVQHESNATRSSRLLRHKTAFKKMFVKVGNSLKWGTTGSAWNTFPTPWPTKCRTTPNLNLSAWSLQRLSVVSTLVVSLKSWLKYNLLMNQWLEVYTRNTSLFWLSGLLKKNYTPISNIIQSATRSVLESITQKLVH